MIVVDVETTGLNPKKYSIVSIGAVEFYHPQDQVYAECRIFDDAEISDQALEINGFSRLLLEAPLFSEFLALPVPEYLRRDV